MFIISCIVLNIIPTFSAMRQPEQSAYVKIIKKEIGKRRNGTPEGNYYMTFEFADGREKKLRCTAVGQFETVQENDTGTLTYKECQNPQNKDYSYYHRVFVRFEKEKHK